MQFHTFNEVIRPAEEQASDVAYLAHTLQAANIIQVQFHVHTIISFVSHRTQPLYAIQLLFANLLVASNISQLELQFNVVTFAIADVSFTSGILSLSNISQSISPLSDV
jgi:hypothetical protein